MVDAALAFDEQHAVRVRRVREHELFGRAAREVGDHAIDRRAGAGDHDAGLTGRDERARTPRSRAARVSSSDAVILPTAQSLPTVNTTRGATS
jgi:hypothetical protein